MCLLSWEERGVPVLWPRGQPLPAAALCLPEGSHGAQHPAGCRPAGTGAWGGHEVSPRTDSERADSGRGCWREGSPAVTPTPPLAQPLLSSRLPRLPWPAIPSPKDPSPGLCLPPQRLCSAWGGGTAKPGLQEARLAAMGGLSDLTPGEEGETAGLRQANTRGKSEAGCLRPQWPRSAPRPAGFSPQPLLPPFMEL